MTVKVLTLNLWNRSGPYPQRRARIRAWVDTLQPDVVGFQEALRGPGFDQVAEILAGAGYQIAYAPAVPFWEDAALDFGNAVASRWPISEQETLTLPDAGDRDRRVALGVTIAAPFGPLAFTSTHLNWKPHESGVRERQVAALCAFVRRRQPRGGFPGLLVGDFNTTPDSAAIRFVTGLQALEGGSVFFLDAWQVAGTGSDGITWANRNRFNRTDGLPDRRIDYIFASPPRAGLGVVERCRVVCDDEQDGVWPSDHFGVFAELRDTPATT